MLPGVMVLSTPATSLGEGPSGGVALLLPTFLHGLRHKVRTLVEGYALFVSLQLGGMDVDLFCVYLRPGKEREMLIDLKHALRELQKTTTLNKHIILAGDVNQIAPLRSGPSSCSN